MMTVEELVLSSSDGMQLSAQMYNAKAVGPTASKGTLNILCLHGWLDNCRSFHFLAPELASQLSNNAQDGRPPYDVNVVCLDFLGHGWSSHKSMDGPTVVLSESAFYVAEVVQKLGWVTGAAANNNNTKGGPKDDGTTMNGDSTTNGEEHQKIIIVGHSMGAAIGCVYAASFPEQLDKLVLLDGAGPLDRRPEDIAKHVRSHIERRQVGNAKLAREGRMQYPSLDVAVNLRRKTATNFPGDQYLSAEAAREMVLRGSIVDEETGKVRFTHDPRLRWPSAHYFTVEQTEALYKDIQCPTCVLKAMDGWPMEEQKQQRMLELLQPVHKTLLGSHHFHADPETAPTVAKEVVEFLRS